VRKVIEILDQMVEQGIRLFFVVVPDILVLKEKREAFSSLQSHLRLQA